MYSHTYYDDETDEWIDVYDGDDDDDGGLRNAREPAGARGRTGRRRPVRAGGRTASGRRPRRIGGDHDRPGRIGRPRRGDSVEVIRPHAGHPPAPTAGDDRISIDKAALIEIVPAVGAVWASFLGRPGMPEATGDDVTDRDNAAAHRDALAQHQQNQTRILALTDLAERAVRLFTR